MSRQLTSRRAWRCGTTSMPDVGLATNDPADLRPVRPEAGRETMFDGPEHIFVVIDTDLAEVQMSQVTRTEVHHDALIAANLFAITEDFFCSRRRAASWWRSQPLGTSPPDRIAVAEAISLIFGDHLWSLLDTHVDIADLWQQRSIALVRYRRIVPVDATDTVLHKILRAHCSRMRAVDAVSRETCMRLAGIAAASWRPIAHPSRR